MRSTGLMEDLYLEYIKNSHISNKKTDDPCFKGDITEEDVGIASKSMKNAHHPQSSEKLN